MPVPPKPPARRVLVADDDRVLSHLLASRLRAKGWHVDVAMDAMQALMFAMRSPPSVITLDINMPGGTGIEALKKLKQSARTSQIPVVVISGSIDQKDEPMMMDLGAAAFVRKPADVDELHSILVGLLDGTF